MHYFRTLNIDAPCIMTNFPIFLTKYHIEYTSMKQLKNITRFTYEFTSFQGWRVTICRQNHHFTRYFSDKQYGGEEPAFQAAVSIRDKIIEMLHTSPNQPAIIFKHCQDSHPQNATPRGLRACRQSQIAWYRISLKLFSAFNQSFASLCKALVECFITKKITGLISIARVLIKKIHFINQRAPIFTNPA